MCDNFSKTRTCPSQAKNQPRGSSSFFNQFCTYKHIYTKRTKVFVHVQTMPHGRNMHATHVISTEDNFKRSNISNHRLNLKLNIFEVILRGILK